MKAELDSPLALHSTAQLVQNIDVKELIFHYQKKFKIDVSKYFHGFDEIGIYECNTTNYKFYYPFNIDGDSAFYRKLQDFEWYYMPWKWEHEKVKGLLKGHEHILEVGSGDFGFVERMQNEGFAISGLELNEDSVIKAKQRNLNGIEESIQNHAKTYSNTYDIVCAFQVLEHIWDVRSFIEAKIDCLKKEGKLVVAVPNNDSFIRYSDGGLLNKPPHHMGLWNATSLTKLVECFNLELEKIYYEPLQDYHLNWYVDSLIASKFKPHGNLYRLLKKLKLKRWIYHYAKMNQKNIKGHSMLAVYKKVR